MQPRDLLPQIEHVGDDALAREERGGVERLVRAEEAAVKGVEDLHEDRVQLLAREERLQLLVHRDNVLGDRLDARRGLGAAAILRRREGVGEGGDVRAPPLLEDGDELGEELLRARWGEMKVRWGEIWVG